MANCACSPKAVSIILKLLGILALAFQAANGVLRFIYKYDESTVVIIVYYIVAVYLVALGIIGILTMFIKKLNFLFKFLDFENFRGRGFYYIFCGCLMFDWVVMRELSCCIILCVLGFVHIICSCQTTVKSNAERHEVKA